MRPMMPTPLRSTRLGAIAALLLLAAPLGAQQLRVSPMARPDSLLFATAHEARLAPGGAAPRARLAAPAGRSIIGTVGGAVVGAFLGYFASQIVESDWENQTGAADQNRRAFAIGGAAVGAVAGYAIMRPRSGESINERFPRSGVSYDSRDRDLIVQSEIVASGTTNAFDLVQTRRPHWLSTRGTNTFREEGRAVGQTERGLIMEAASDQSIIVYLDRARLGGVEKLREISVSSFTTVRYLDARAATFQFGSGHDHGAIVLITK